MEFTPYEQLNDASINICRNMLQNTLEAVQKMERLRDNNKSSEEAVSFMELFTNHTNNHRLTQAYVDTVNLCERVVVQVSVVLQLYVVEKCLSAFLKDAFEKLIASLDACETIMNLNKEILGDNYVKYDVRIPSHYDKVISFIEKRHVMKDILIKHS